MDRSNIACRNSCTRTWRRDLQARSCTAWIRSGTLAVRARSGHAVELSRAAKILICVLAAAFGLACPLLAFPSAAATLTGNADIVDGDTIKVGAIPVRLYGIDAPEDRQTCERDGKTYACGKQATKALASLIAGRSVQCEIVGKDNYARALGVCTVADTELNRTMVRHG